MAHIISAVQFVKRDGRSRDRGFTLLELMVVIVILGMLISLVAPAVVHQLGKSRISVTRLSIQRMSSFLEMYKVDTGNYPSTDQGLQALITDPGGVDNWSGPYMKGDSGLLDQWNHPYIYRYPSNRTDHDYDLCSGGPDAQSASSMICNK